MDINQLGINTLRINGVAAINKANSGHPGIVLGAAPIMHTLFTKHIRFDPSNPTWVNRDRFVLSAGHGSALLYAQLRLLNLLTEKDLKEFRQFNSLTPGHPEFGHTKGIDATSGPLGQGIGMAVGMAVAEESLRSKYNEINHYTYALCGDGCLQEGVAMEAMAFAGKQKLSKIILLHDSNDIQLDTEVKSVVDEDRKMRMEAIKWDYQLVEDPTIENIDAAINKAKKSDKPSFIEVKTIIGLGASKQGTCGVHGAPLGDDLEKVKNYYDWKHGDFEIPKEVEDLYKKIILNNNKLFNDFKPSDELDKFLKTDSASIELEIDSNQATRASSGDVIKYLNNNLENWIGGSADLVASTKVAGGDGDFMPDNRSGRNILFGVREFAMATIANGLALHSNFKPFVSTFFVFSDYLKPAMRMSALMKLPVTYIFTHDSIFVGEDGPTHEPVEQLAMIRSIPNIVTIRPADEKEVLGAYKIALSNKRPTNIVLTRQNIVSQEKTKDDISQGAYVIHKGAKDTTIVATGSEVSLAIEVAKISGSTVVSMPSTNLFDEQTKEYKNSILPNYEKTLTLELGSTFGWAKYGKHNFGLDDFGMSAPGDEIYKSFGFTVDNLSKILEKL